MKRDRSVTKRDKPLTKGQVDKIVDQMRDKGVTKRDKTGYTADEFTKPMARIRDLEQMVNREMAIALEWQREAERYLKEVKRLMEVMDRIQNGIGGDPVKIARGAFRMGLPNAK